MNAPDGYAGAFLCTKIILRVIILTVDTIVI